MLILFITVVNMAVAGGLVWLLAWRWSTLLAPRVSPARVQKEVRRHPRLAARVSARLDPSVATGLALTAVSALIAAGVIGFGALLWMVRSNAGFARFDLGAARFAGRHASALSTQVLRTFTQLGGAVVLVPITIVVCIVASRRLRGRAVAGLLLLTVGGQFAVVDLIKWAVDRTRPDIDRLTGFSGPSFPSGHATAAAASFAVFALLAGLGRSKRVKATLASVAAAIAVGIATTRVFLGVHWFTDVLAGLILGWSWFALCSMAFGGRLLRFGAPVAQAERAAESIPIEARALTTS
jgi:undecaprenyl-diphosphatase